MATIIFDNRAHIGLSEGCLLRVKNEAHLPSGRLLLVLSDGPLPENNLGVCIPRALLRFAPGYRRMFDQAKREDWDCGIAVSKKVCQMKEKHPAYFAYILGHEIGHASVCLIDISVHIHSCLIEEFIRAASDDMVTQATELPHEVLCDKRGIHIAERIFSRERLNADITEIVKMPDCKDAARLRRLLSLSSSSNLGDLKDLRNDLVAISMPYKDRLIDLWKKDVAQRGSNSLASLIHDYDALFE